MHAVNSLSFRFQFKYSVCRVCPRVLIEPFLLDLTGQGMTVVKVQPFRLIT